MRRLILVQLAWTLAACATAPTPASAPAADAESLIDYSDPCPIDAPEEERSERQWFTRADCLQRAGQYDKAISVVEDALTYFPESVSLYSVMAFSYAETRDWRESIRASRVALALSAASHDTTAFGTRNNLLWASVWVDGAVPEAEQLAHLHVLDRVRLDCPALHTAIFVLHPIALGSRSDDHVGALDQYADRFLRECVEGPSESGEEDVVALEDVYAALVMLDQAALMLDGHGSFVKREMPLAFAARAVVRAMPEGRLDADVCADTLPDPALHPECVRGLTQARAALKPAAPPSR